MRNWRIASSYLKLIIRLVEGKLQACELAQLRRNILTVEFVLLTMIPQTTTMLVVPLNARLRPNAGGACSPQRQAHVAAALRRLGLDRHNSRRRNARRFNRLWHTSVRFILTSLTDSWLR